ncbi:pyridoxamine 5'-phosphate oxidase family protein [Actinoplanes sp. NPDC020271]|uniref:pyridoxamine 5'-phosphate oxidase family protein n=1 Tax=Actinoplanes sp. NPDC020271 TaxID=3363896 RepID=UPI0037A1CE8D
MGKVYEGIDDRLRDFILAQPVFFVATAPSGAGGHVSLSPKGGTGTLAVLGRHRVAYLDYTGSGAETIAHLRDNGRITLMACAFRGPPKILRLYGCGRPVLPGDAGFAELLASFPGDPGRGLRAIIDVEVERVSDACGYQVPLMEYAGDRDLLVRWTDRKSDEELAEYRRTRNDRSIDGLPAVPETFVQPDVPQGGDVLDGTAG